MSNLKGNFSYVFIPANDSLPIEVRTGDKSGGLSDDCLSKEAKRYFYDNSDKGDRQRALEGATAEQRKQLAQQLRDEIQGAAAASQSPYASQMLGLDDDALINIMKTQHTSQTCEITAITVPTPLNNHRAVSMYTADDARTQNLPYNRRATELLLAAGHSINQQPSPQTVSIGAAPPGGICGDAFVGRCHDNEVADIWERVDFAVEDADPKAQWCGVARLPGGGGSGPGGEQRSLTGVMNQNALPSTAPQDFKSGSADGYTYTQNDDEVELRFPVASGTKAKYVKINYGKSSLKVTVAGQTLISGELGGDIVKDDSTFTIEDANSGSGKELCLTLGKKESHTWPFIVR